MIYFLCANLIIDRRKAWVMPESKYSIGGIKNGISILFFTMKEVLQMPNTEQPIDLETQVMLIKKYVNFRQRKKMREFLGDAGFYLDKQYYTPTKSEKDKKTRNRNVSFFHTKFFAGLKNDEEKLRRDVVKHPELKEYRKGGTRQNNVLPVWAAFSYFEMGTMVLIYSYLRGDLRKEVLDYTYSQKNYKKEVTKQMDTWLDAVRNLRNYCAHHSMLVGMTSSVVIPDNRDSSDVLPDNTNLYSRLYALKKILSQEDANMLETELARLVSRAKIDVYKMNILPSNWKDLYDRILFL